uniref:Uncharacterized protein n=1 Tax=viral metagenome TaxID=1070528 RepID=A0A6C0I8U1_9ZZZZ
MSHFDFVRNHEKMNLLHQINDRLNINKNANKKLIFVYTPPKVGSTSVVSSLRIFGSAMFNIIHIHDEEMLRVLSDISGVTVNEIIQFNKYLGRDVYVIDVYRSPIERKISAYFEKVGVYHFNTSDENVNTYNIDKVINRFNKIFPYLAIGDHFMDLYNIPLPQTFDFEQKYLLIEHNGIKYIKLRLKDSDCWSHILTNLFSQSILVIKDYESTNKPIKNLYVQFKNQYRLPSNFLVDIINCKYLNYYYSPSEKQEYINQWMNKQTCSCIFYTENEYKLYDELTIENAHLDYIQVNHYMDEGCLCKACFIKRNEIAKKLSNNLQINDRVVHSDAKNELMKKRVAKANQINAFNASVASKMNSKSGHKDFRKDMTNIVRNKK